MWSPLTSLWNSFVQFGTDHLLILGIDAILTGLLLQPLCNFLSYGWVRKSEEVETSLIPEAKRTYLKVFWGRDVSPAEAPTEFSALYSRWYGRRRYWAPLALVFVIAAVENFYLAQELIRLITESVNSQSATVKLTTSAAAIAGAYTFVTWDFFGRVQRRDLSTTDILRGALRLAMAMPVGFAFAVISDGIGAFLAFAVGVFPLETISTILRRLANDKLKIELGANTSPDQIGTLAGIDRSIADRIEDADITTVPQLAWCDPIQLTMRSNLAFDYVVDIVSQALAWVYLGEKLTVLRTFGLRGAYEIRLLINEMSSPDPSIKAKAAAVLPVAAAAVNMPLEGFEYALVLIAEDNATQFLFDAA
jgi:hypothetical protein